MATLNGHKLNGHGHKNGDADMSAPVKERNGNPLISLLPENRKSVRVAKIVAARDRYLLASQLLEKADEYATRAATAPEADRPSLEAVASEHLAEATKLRQEAQAILERF